MKKGEQATLIIDHTLGYGDKGSGKIPAKATLFFDVSDINSSLRVSVSLDNHKPYF